MIAETTTLLNDLRSRMETLSARLSDARIHQGRMVQSLDLAADAYSSAWTLIGALGETIPASDGSLAETHLRAIATLLRQAESAGLDLSGSNGAVPTQGKTPTNPLTVSSEDYYGADCDHDVAYDIYGDSDNWPKDSEGDYVGVRWSSDDSRWIVLDPDEVN